MRAMIISLIVVVLSILSVFYPEMKAGSYEEMARVLLYFAFPMAIGLSLVMVAIGHALGFPEYDAADDVHKAASHEAFNPERKVS